MGVGEVLWHSLTESGKVERVNIQFGENVYENVDVKHLKPVKMEAHGHPAEKPPKIKKKKKNNESIMINGKEYRPIK